MSSDCYSSNFNPKRFISLEKNVLSEIEPHSEQLLDEQHDLVRWIVYWDGAQSLQLFGVTKDSLAILQNCLIIQGKTKRTALKYAKKLIPSEGSAEWAQCPFLIYNSYRYSYKYECHIGYEVFWNGHSRFMLGTGDEIYDEAEIDESWFERDHSAYVDIDYDDDKGYLDDPGIKYDIPSTRSSYADAPESLISVAEDLVNSEVQKLDIASASEVFDGSSDSKFGSFVGGLFSLVFGLGIIIRSVIKLIIYGLIGLILLNLINYFTGWIDVTDSDDLALLFLGSGVILWASLTALKSAWKKSKEGSS